MEMSAINFYYMNKAWLEEMKAEEDRLLGEAVSPETFQTTGWQAYYVARKIREEHEEMLRVHHMNAIGDFIDIPVRPLKQHRGFSQLGRVCDRYGCSVVSAYHALLGVHFVTEEASGRYTIFELV